MKIGQLEIDLGELANFIVNAKKKGYAGGEEKTREVDGSKTFTFEEGNFYYTDNYAGSSQAPGDEIVRWRRKNGQRIWHMAYSGGMNQEYWNNDVLSEQTFKFLKEVLMQVTPDLPFRGPQRYENEDFRYTMEVNGDIQRFSGAEWISGKKLRGETVFSQDFIGGLVIPKTK